MNDVANDDDIVEHSDILSSPSKSVASRIPLFSSKGSPRRRRECARRQLLERICISEDGRSAILEEEEVLQTPRKKRGRKSAVESEVETDFDLARDNEVRVKELGIDGVKLEPVAPTVILEPETEVKVDQLPATPSKRPAQSTSVEHDFTSPLKSAILNNLQDYKETASSQPLKLSRNFHKTPLPTKNEQFVSQSEKVASSFFDTCEGYFDQRKGVRGSKRSKNTMSMATELTREEFALISNVFHKNLHKAARSDLYAIQRRMFPQYWLELLQGFSLLFYGIGSKREFMEKYAFEYLVPNLAYSQMSKAQEANPGREMDVDDFNVPCIVINGYNPTCNYREVFKDISAALLSEELTRNETKYWGNHVLLHIQKMIEIYKDQSPDIRLVIIVHNLDGPSLRKDAFQTMLCYLALIRQVAIIASTDHIYAPILWENFKAQNYNFVFHDVTNYEPFTVESSFRDVMKMSKSDSASGAEGAKYVLESLTVNSKKMYRLLVETQLSNMEKATNAKGKVAPTKRGVPALGIEFKQLLHLCAAEFIASNELSLRSMLTEFVEHKMANVSKNPAGTEHVWVPYNYSEMTKLLTTALKEL